MWAVIPDLVDVAPYYCVPHTAPGGVWLVGGPSNAGGLFLDWVTAAARRRRGRAERPRPIRAACRVWVPYPRGERVPINDPDAARRSSSTSI